MHFENKPLKVKFSVKFLRKKKLKALISFSSPLHGPMVAPYQYNKIFDAYKIGHFSLHSHWFLQWLRSVFGPLFTDRLTVNTMKETKDQILNLSSFSNEFHVYRSKYWGEHVQSPSLPVIDNMEQGTEKKGVATETNMLLHSSGAARGVEGGKLPPIRVDAQKLCNMCVLSL